MLILMLALTLWSVIAYGAADPTMVLALSFDEGQGKVAKDSSKFGFDGVVKANWVNGRFGKALEFDGSGADSVVVADEPELLLLEGGTLMAWAFIMTEAGHADWNRIIIKAPNNGGTTGGYDLLFDRKLGYSIRFCVVECASHFPVESDSWHHVAITFDGEIITIYADGVNVGEVPQPGPTVDSSGFDLHIGNGAAFDRAYHGLLDEVRIWNRALDENEINLQMESSTIDIIAVEPDSKLATTWANVKAIFEERVQF